MPSKDQSQEGRRRALATENGRPFQNLGDQTVEVLRSGKLVPVAAERHLIAFEMLPVEKRNDENDRPSRRLDETAQLEGGGGDKGGGTRLYDRPTDIEPVRIDEHFHPGRLSRSPGGENGHSDWKCLGGESVEARWIQL